MFAKRSIVFWLITFIWIGMILYLSSQNGEQTAALSGGFAESIANIIYRHPSAEQLEQVHMIIRKLAHVVLFLVLGILSCMAGEITFSMKEKNWIVFVVSAILIIGCAFLDEWHKQFIPGRHFDVGETVLNMCCGVAGIVIAGGITWVSRRCRRLLSEKDDI